MSCWKRDPLVQWEIVLLMQYCDRVDQSMKLSTVFVEGMYSNIRRGAFQIYIPLKNMSYKKLWSPRIFLFGRPIQLL